MKTKMKTAAKILFLWGAVILATAGGAKEVQAKKVKVKLDLSGEKTVTKKPAALKKAKKVTVKYSKKSVVKVSVKKKKLLFSAKKKGTATVTITCRLKNKKKKVYKYAVTVKNTQTKSGSVSRAFTGNLKAKALASGSVKLTWTKMKDAKLYRLERRTNKGVWKKISNPSGTSYLDRTTVSGTTYGYRMKARLSDEWTEYGEEVEVLTEGEKEKTGEKAEEETKTTPIPISDNELLTYDYDIGVISNKTYTLYTNQIVLMYIKTNYSEIDNMKVTVENGVVYTPMDYVDIVYNEERNLYNVQYDLLPVDDGYLLGVLFNKAGTNTIKLYLGQEGKTGSKDWVVVKRFDVIIKDYSDGEDKWVEKVIEENTVPTMTDAEKMETLKLYIRSNFVYDLSDLNGNVIHLANREGVYWERGWIDCIDATNIMGLFAEKLNLEWEFTYAGYLNHYYATVYINGESHIYDACPYQETGILKSWDYLL